MVTRADGDALGIEKGGYVVRVNAVDGEGNDGCFSGCISVNGEARKGFQSGGGLLEQALLVGNGCGKIEVAEIFDGGTETDGSLDVGRSRLEALGWGSVGGFLEGHLVDHIAPALVGRHIGEQFLFAVKDPDAHRGKYLVPREGEEIAIDCSEIHGAVGDALGAVDYGDDAAFLGLRYDFGYGVYGAEGVGHVAEREKLGLGMVENGAEGVAVKGSVIQNGGDLDLDSRTFSHELPWHDVGMVLHGCERDDVSFCEMNARVTLGD